MRPAKKNPIHVQSFVQERFPVIIVMAMRLIDFSAGLGVVLETLQDFPDQANLGWSDTMVSYLPGWQ